MALRSPRQSRSADKEGGHLSLHDACLRWGPRPHRCSEEWASSTAPPSTKSKPEAGAATPSPRCGSHRTTREDALRYEHALPGMRLSSPGHPSELGAPSRRVLVAKRILPCASPRPTARPWSRGPRARFRFPSRRRGADHSQPTPDTVRGLSGRMRRVATAGRLPCPSAGRSGGSCAEHRRRAHQGVRQRSACYVSRSFTRTWRRLRRRHTVEAGHFGLSGLRPMARRRLFEQDHARLTWAYQRPLR